MTPLKPIPAFPAANYKASTCVSCWQTCVHKGLREKNTLIRCIVEEKDGQCGEGNGSALWFDGYFWRKLAKRWVLLVVQMCSVCRLPPPPQPHPPTHTPLPQTKGESQGYKMKCRWWKENNFLFSVIHLFLLRIPGEKTLRGNVAEGGVRSRLLSPQTQGSRRGGRKSRGARRGKERETVTVLGREEEVWSLWGEMMLMIGLLLLAGCGRAGESEFYICDVAKRVRKKGGGKVCKAAAIDKYLMWWPCAHESIFLWRDVKCNIFFNARSKKLEPYAWIRLAIYFFPCHNF